MTLTMQEGPNFFEHILKDEWCIKCDPTIHVIIVKMYYQIFSS